MRIHSLAPTVLALFLFERGWSFLSPKPATSFVSKIAHTRHEPKVHGGKSHSTRLLVATDPEVTFGTPSTNVEGTIPPRSHRTGKVAELPVQDPGNAVKITESTKELTYVADIRKIDSGPISGRETVKAWTLENEHIAVKGVLLGGNLMGFQFKDEEYLWLNKEGAVGYGANSNAFPLTRGLFLHGGVRMAAVTAEHGLYYDTEWDLDFEVDARGNSASLIFKIKDDQEARDLLNDQLSAGGFSGWDEVNRMSNYPVTNAEFIFKVTLRKGEKFLRTECTVDNQSDEAVQAEAWMPQTWPVTEDSQIISHQKKRRVKGHSGAYVVDSWVMTEMIDGNYLASDMGLDDGAHLKQYDGTLPFSTKGKEGQKNGWLIAYPPAPLNGNYNPEMDLNYPLQWPSKAGGILYDFPYMDGNYHAVSFGDGRGVAYVAPESTEDNPHFTKMWSWGAKALFNRAEAAKQNPPLAAGRPATEYYEPWASAFNTAFFELYQFPPGKSSWEARFVPIAEGLDADKKQYELRKVVDAAVEDAVKSL